MAFLCERPGRLTARNGGFRPGQEELMGVRGKYGDNDTLAALVAGLVRPSPPLRWPGGFPGGPASLFQRAVVGRGHVSLLTDLDTWHIKPFRVIAPRTTATRSSTLGKLCG